MPPKTEWGNPTIEIKNGDKWEPLVVIVCEPRQVGRRLSPSLGLKALATGFARQGSVIEELRTTFGSLHAAFKALAALQGGG